MAEDMKSVISTDKYELPHKEGSAETEQGTISPHDGVTVTTPANQDNQYLIYNRRHQPLYKTWNPFSHHDNRHSVQDKAEYFGNGRDTRLLGRRLHAVDKRVHQTDVTLLYDHSQTPLHDRYSSITATSFRDPGLIEPLKHRRFPKIYRNAQSSQPVSGTETSPDRTPLHVLAVTQEPFLHKNKWKYSYRSDPRVYPPCNIKRFPPAINILSRYGADFTTLLEPER